MRTVFDSFDAFCLDISERAAAIRVKTVRAMVLRQPEQEENVSFQVGFVASAIADDGPEGDLLEVAIQCGQDTAEQRSRGQMVKAGETAGSDGAAKLFAKLKEICERAEPALKLRQGKIELY